MTPMDGPLVSCTGVSKWYGDVPALLDVSLEIPEGQAVALFGSNGAGKTTLLRLLATLARPTEGEIAIAGANAVEDDAAVRGVIGFVGHEPGIYADLTVVENLRFFGKLYGVTAIDDRVDDLIRSIGLQRFRRQRARTLSRGTRQRLGLARALLHDPRLLLLDEPDTGLDAEARRFVEGALAKSGRTTIFATHDRAWGARVADRMIVLDRGRIAFDGPAADGVTTLVPRATA